MLVLEPDLPTGKLSASSSVVLSIELELNDDSFSSKSLDGVPEYVTSIRVLLPMLRCFMLTGSTFHEAPAVCAINTVAYSVGLVLAHYYSFLNKLALLLYIVHFSFKTLSLFFNSWSQASH